MHNNNNINVDFLTEPVTTSLSLAEFKRRMLVEISKAIDNAPERPAELVALVESYQDFQRTGRHRRPKGYWKEDTLRSTSLADLREKHNIGTVCLSVSKGGTYTIENTRQALTAFRKKVQSFSVAEHIPEIPREHKGYSVPATKHGKPFGPKFRMELENDPGAGNSDKNTYQIPIPSDPRVSRAPDMLSVVGDCDYISNGYYLVLKSVLLKQLPIAKPDAQKCPAQKILDVAEEKFKLETRARAEEIGRLWGTCYLTAIFTNRETGQGIFGFDAKYTDWLYNNVFDFSLFIDFDKPPENGAIIMSGAKKVGVLMPLDLSHDNLVQRIKILKVDPALAKLSTDCQYYDDYL